MDHVASNNYLREIFKLIGLLGDFGGVGFIGDIVALMRLESWSIFGRFRLLCDCFP